jgi:alpha-L-arabinofuranosidase
MKEYEACATLIVHWDKFFYETSKFYMFIESALLAVVFSQLSAQLVDEKPMRPELISLFVCLTLFNLILCYVWFRANRSCREYLKISFIRALQIENDPALKGVVQLANVTRNKLNQKENIKHSSDWWEIHVPILFMIAWAVYLISAAFDSHDFVAAIIVGLIFVLVIRALIFIERTGWPNLGGIRNVKGKNA